MKKLTSLEDLKSLIPKDYKSESTIKPKPNFKKQTIEAHYSVKGRAGTPVIILKGFLYKINFGRTVTTID